jgi:hypothetical protein
VGRGLGGRGLFKDEKKSYNRRRAEPMDRKIRPVFYFLSSSFIFSFADK